MPNQELAEYIKQLLTQGVSEWDTRRSLITAGWAEEDVSAAFVAVKSSTQQNTAVPAAVTRASTATKTPAALLQEKAAARPTIATTAPSGAATSTLQKNTSRRLPLRAIVIALVAVLLVGGLAFAYTTKTWPFKKSAGLPLELYNKVLDRVGDIHSAAYTLSFSFVSQPRDADAKPLTAAFPELEKEQPLYDRDQSRFNDIQTIQNKLSAIRLSHENGKPVLKPYPKTLAEIGITLKDPLGEPYQYESLTSSTYSLTVTFETLEAIEAVRKESDIAGLGDDKWSKTNSKTVSFSHLTVAGYYFNAKPKAPAFVAAIQDQDDFYAFLPADISVVASASGLAAMGSQDLVDNKFEMSGAADIGNFSLSGDVESIKKGDTYYVRLNKFPMPFIDVSPIKQKWVKITPDDIAAAANYSLGALQKEVQINMNKVVDQLKLFFRIAQEEQALTIKGEPGADKQNNALIHYELILNKKNVASFYKRLTDEFKKQYGNDSLIQFDEKTLSYLESQSFGDVFDYWNNNSKFELWIDSETGYPAKFSYGFRMVPTNTNKKLKDTQFYVIFGIALNNINKKVDVAAPDQAMSLEDAQIAMTGVTKEEYLFNKQVSALSSIRYALTTHYTLTGTYPDSLQDLTRKGGEITRNTESSARSYYMEMYKDKPLLTSIPKDTFTGEAFQYSETGNNFMLTYTMKLPSYEKGYRIPYSIMKTSYSVASPLPQSRFQTIMKSTYALAYVDGVNTVNSSTLSAEADAVAKIDNDKDGLSDTLEDYLGTDKSKKDTDGDGYTDGEELQKYSNPLGPGNLKYKSRDSFLNIL